MIVHHKDINLINNKTSSLPRNATEEFDQTLFLKTVFTTAGTLLLLPNWDLP